MQSSCPCNSPPRRTLSKNLLRWLPPPNLPLLSLPSSSLPLPSLSLPSSLLSLLISNSLSLPSPPLLHQPPNNHKCRRNLRCEDKTAPRFIPRTTEIKSWTVGRTTKDSSVMAVKGNKTECTSNLLQSSRRETSTRKTS